MSKVSHERDPFFMLSPNLLIILSENLEAIDINEQCSKLLKSNINPEGELSFISSVHPEDKESFISTF